MTYRPVSLNIRLQADPSKAEEIAVVEKLREHFGDTGTYLESLFNSGFVGWVSEQIRNDFSPNLYEWYTGEMRSKQEAESVLRAEVSSVRSQLKEATAELENYLEQYSWKDKQVDQWKAALAHANEERRQLDESWKVEVERLEEIRNGLVDDLDKLRRESERKDLSILSLKARLFDLMEVKEN